MYALKTLTHVVVVVVVFAYDEGVERCLKAGSRLRRKNMRGPKPVLRCAHHTFRRLLHKTAKFPPKICASATANFLLLLVTHFHVCFMFVCVCFVVVALQRCEKKEFYYVTTTDDPVIEKLAVEGEGNVFATDGILAHLMASPRTIYPWDIVVQKVKNCYHYDVCPKYDEKFS